MHARRIIGAVLLSHVLLVNHVLQPLDLQLMLWGKFHIYFTFISHLFHIYRIMISRTSCPSETPHDKYDMGHFV